MDMDLTLLVTIGIIFLTTFIGAALSSLARDRCLKDLDEFHITVKKKDKKLIWGVLHLESTGFELIYRTDHLDNAQTHVETSYVIYRDEYPNIQAIYRYVDQLDAKNRTRRDRSLAGAFHPGPFRRAWRSLRNFANTANDALRDVLDLLLGRSKLMTGQTVLAPGQTRLKGMTKDIVGYVGTRYDPLLEHFIGVRVVFEISEDNSWQEYTGVLKEYSAEFLELLDVYVSEITQLTLEIPPSPEEIMEADEGQRPQVPATEPIEVQVDTVRARLDGDIVTIENRTTCPLFLEAIDLDDESMPVQVIVHGAESLRCQIPDRPKVLSLNIRTVRQLDVVVPRAHAVVRHRAERYLPIDDFWALLPPSLWPGERAPKLGEMGEIMAQMDDAQAVLKRWLFLANYGRATEASRYLKNSTVRQDTLVLQESQEIVSEQRGCESVPPSPSSPESEG